MCGDPSSEGVPWCYVNDPDKYLREPCFMPRKLVLYVYFKRNRME